MSVCVYCLSATNLHKYKYRCCVGGNTVVVRSEGRVLEDMADVLGVFRLVDSHDERPLYKQDEGENFIYFR